MFRFVILGAAHIAVKFVEAVTLIPNCEVTAVASKDFQRAKDFAEKNKINHFYADYEEMLKTEKADCAYIAVTPNDHFRLSVMCLENNVPVLCEKAMFQGKREAEIVFELAKQKQLFVMEALWSRFLPTIKKVRDWVQADCIGPIEFSQFMIGFAAPKNIENRYFNPELGGGASRDITVYAYEITTYILQQKIKKLNVTARFSNAGVDVSSQVSIQFEYTLASLMSTFLAAVDEKMILSGQKGRIVIPHPHYASECMCYNENGELVEHYVDDVTKNGFVYEIEEAMKCIQQGKLESSVVPWQDTLDCAALFDQIMEQKL